MGLSKVAKVQLILVIARIVVAAMLAASIGGHAIPPIAMAAFLGAVGGLGGFALFHETVGGYQVSYMLGFVFTLVVGVALALAVPAGRKKANIEYTNKSFGDYMSSHPTLTWAVVIFLIAAGLNYLLSYKIVTSDE